MKFLFLGDVVLNQPFRCAPEVATLLKTHYCVANLEAPFTKEALQAPKAGVWVRSNEEFLPIFSEHIDAVTLANNHMMDYKEEGLNYTRRLLTQNGIAFCGAGGNSEEAHAPLVVGDTYIFAVCENEFGASTKNKSGVAVYDDLRILYNNIQECKKKGTVVVCYHGGSEIIPSPQTYLRERFNLLKEFGANIIIGTHPHVVQGYEDNIFYSLGNFFFVNDGFAQYKNSDWSLAVSFDSETLESSPIALRVEDGELRVDTSQEHETELQKLSELIQSPEYENLSDTISCILHERWYPEWVRSGELHALAHHLRCDAHANNIIKGVSRYIGEYSLSPEEKYQITLKDVDCIEIKER